MKVHIGPYRKNRKIDVRIDPYDTWGMHCTLAYIILPLLKQLKETKHGSALMDAHLQTSSSSTQFCFDFYKEDDDKAWDEGHKQFEEILDKMIWAFEQINTDWEDKYWSGESDFYSEKVPGTDGYTVKEGPNHTLTCDTKGLKEHSERMLEGFELFGKYYLDLWD